MSKSTKEILMDVIVFEEKKLFNPVACLLMASFLKMLQKSALFKSNAGMASEEVQIKGNLV